MDQDVKVLIVTPSYNQGQFIEATIQSVLNQTYKNIQYVIADGGSTDDTMKVVDKYRSRIDVVFHEKDKGQTDAINKGFRLATGELAGWINSDDVLHPRCVETAVALYKKHPDGSIYYNSEIDFIDIDGNPIKKYSNQIPDRDFLLRKNYSVTQPGSFYSVPILKKIGFLDTSLHYCMDLDLWLRLLEHGPIYSFREPQAGFRQWGDTKTSTGGAKFLKEIRKTLLKSGAQLLDPSVRQTYWYQLKFAVKRLIPN